jgi:hypothetical protein
MADSWTSSWGPPVSMCLFRGQVFMGGRKVASPSADARRIRWSEIGAFKFLGATATSQRNEAGEYYLDGSDTEMVMRLLPMLDAVIVYGSFVTLSLSPVAQPAPTFSPQTIVNTGITNPLAVAGDRNKHVCIDRSGYLRLLVGSTKSGYESKIIGYDDIFGPMQAGFNFTTGTGIISVVYNPDDEEYYISNGSTSYLFDGVSLTQIDVAISSYTNIKGTVLQGHDSGTIVAGPIASVTTLDANPYLYFSTDTYDFNTSGIKTIKVIEVVGTFAPTSTVEVMVQWRNNRGSVYNSTTWKRCAPSGFVSPNVSGVDFKILVRVNEWEGTSIDSIAVEWQKSDRHSSRGYVTSANTSTQNPNQ